MTQSPDQDYDGGVDVKYTALSVDSLSSLEEAWSLKREYQYHLASARRVVLRFAGIILCLLLRATPTIAQDSPPDAANPLAQLKDELVGVLAVADIPFSEEQDRAITLMLADRRRASEDLFGGLMDFSAGPTRGEEADRLRSAIEWMRNEFLSRLQDYLTPGQLAAWSLYVETSGLAGTTPGEEGVPTGGQGSQTQFVRINNNPFTAEDPSYRSRRGGGGVEVIERGGAGAFHGNVEFLIKDESLNAGRRFAQNKPPYQERQTSFDFGGPVIPGRLSTTFAFSQNEAENVDIIRANLPDQIFSLGITRPTVDRSFDVRNTFQPSDAQSLGFDLAYATDTRDNQGIGGFTLPERASNSTGRDWELEVRQFSTLSSQSLYETTFSFNRGRSETTPATEGVRINVFDAFRSGGAQNRSESTVDTYSFSNLYTRLGEKLTLRAGIDGAFRTNRSFSETNFTGTFTFSSLEAFEEGRPLNFRVTRGDPSFEVSQFELSLFFQNDQQLSPRLTLMYGVRYNMQSNLGDNNNIDPRVGIAYAIGRATVIRVGAGIFHELLPINVVEFYRRLDGTRQHEIFIDDPSYPDAFQSGSVRDTFPSVRVIDPDLAVPYKTVGRASYERTFLSNLFVSVEYDLARTVHRFRNRNVNAAMDITASFPKSCTPGQSVKTCLRPDPGRGNVISVESTGSQWAHNLRVNYRQRFSIFNLTASYAYGASFANGVASSALVRGAGAFGGSGGSGGGGSDNFGFGPEILPSDNYNMGLDWSRLTVPQAHTVNSNLNARMPLGVFLTGIMSYNTGRNYSITTGHDDNMDSSPNDRPPGVKRTSGPAQDFLTFDFNISKAFFFGNTGNGVGGGTRTNANLFANMTNALNRPNYNPPSGVLTSPNFGRSTSAGRPREIEVGMRFQF